MILIRAMCVEISVLLEESLVKECIPLPKKIYKLVPKRLRTTNEVDRYFPGFKAFIDSTEQEIPRPKNNRKRKSYYSGRKRKHTIKTQLMVNTGELTCIRQVTGMEENMIMTFTKTNHPTITPSQVDNIVDSGYLGIEKDYPTIKSVHFPIRKKKNTLLSNDDVRYNKNHSRLRIIVEHTICKIKKFGIMGQSSETD